MENKVKISINNISKDEWEKEIDDYLWLLKEEIEIYSIENANNEELGHIIFTEKFREKLYVKGIYIQNIAKGIKGNVPGFNSNVLKTNTEI